MVMMCRDGLGDIGFCIVCHYFIVAPLVKSSFVCYR